MGCSYFFFSALMCPRVSRGRVFRLLVRLAICVMTTALIFAPSMLYAESANLQIQDADSSQVRTLPNHHPLWANNSNDLGELPPDQDLERMTLVLSRSSDQELAFQSFLADQQNPTSPNYHHWLSPVEIGERFGSSQQDIDTLTGWLQSRGLHVNWVSPSRTFIGFGGTAASIGQAFETG
jgi:subtilase family serine protease